MPGRSLLRFDARSLKESLSHEPPRSTGVRERSSHARPSVGAP